MGKRGSAEVPRWGIVAKNTLHWHGEDGIEHEQDFDGFIAHVIQHEVDHLNGILFVDRVKDTKTYMMQDEFYRRIVKKGR